MYCSEGCFSMEEELGEGEELEGGGEAHLDRGMFQN